MDLTRRDALRLTLSLAVLATSAGALTSCGSGSAPAPRAPLGDLELAASDVQHSAGDPRAVPDAVASMSRLAAGLYGALAATPGNLVLSPYSVAVALAMTANGARGATAVEMRAVLGTDDLAVLGGGLDALTRELEALAGPVPHSDQTIELGAANALFGQRGTTWERPFLDELARQYGAGMRLVDYAHDVEGARVLINEWTSGRTHERIPEIIPAGVLDALTALVLVDAIYLKAPWQEQFAVEDTQPQPFHTDTGAVVQVPTMSLGLDSSGYATGDGWETVRLPYAGQRLAMTVVLPAHGRLAEISHDVAGGGLGEILAASRPTTVDLSLPRWTCRTQASLQEVLAALGMPSAFDPDRADFSGMTREEALYVSAVLHEGFIAVEEHGTEAAAATAVVMELDSAPIRTPVVVDRPFLFVVHDVEHGTPLFLGRVVDPSA